MWTLGFVKVCKLLKMHYMNKYGYVNNAYTKNNMGKKLVWISSIRSRIS